MIETDLASVLDEDLVDIFMLLFLMVIAGSIIFVKRLFAAVMLMGIFSLLTAALFVVLDALDVAFTEAAVGAGVTVVLFVSALALIKDDLVGGGDSSNLNNVPLAAAVCIATALALIVGTLDMPLYGDPAAPIHNHVAPHFIEQSGKEIGIPNIVTSVLASYRGYDTMGEVFVVACGALAAGAILGGFGTARGRREDREDDDAG